MSYRRWEVIVATVVAVAILTVAIAGMKLATTITVMTAIVVGSRAAQSILVLSVAMSSFFIGVAILTAPLATWFAGLAVVCALGAASFPWLGRPSSSPESS